MVVARNLVCFGMYIVCSFPVVSVGQFVPPEPWWADDPGALEPEAHATYEVPEEWKATIYTQLWPRVLYAQGQEFQVENTLCYVEVTDSENQTSRRVWQYPRVSATRNSPDFIFHDFTLGPAKGESFCLAVIFGGSIVFSVVDARDDLPRMEDSSVETGTPRMGADVSKNAPREIRLRDIERLPSSFSRRSLRIDAVSCCGDLATICLRQSNDKAVLRFSLDDEEPHYEVYLLATVSRYPSRAAQSGD